MEDKKISELPSATLPLDDADLLAVVQGGITKKTPKSSVASSTIEKLFTVSLAQIGASDITDVDDVRTKLRDYTIAEGLTKPADELHRWEVVESLAPTIPTLVLVTDDLSAFATSIGITDVNDVSDWNTLAGGSYSANDADFTDVLVEGNTVTLSGGTGALTLFLVSNQANLIGASLANLENLTTLYFINGCQISSFGYFTNLPLLSGLYLNDNDLTVSALDAGLLDWATNEVVNSGILNFNTNTEDLTTSDTYDVLVNTKSWTT